MELSAQIRKKTKMATDYGKQKVEFKLPPTDEELAEERASYTVPIPDDLPEQMIAWECRNIEPYPGFADEYAAWEDAWENINRAQAEADGNPYNYVDNLIL